MRISCRRCAQACSTTSRSGSAAPRRHIGTNLMNDHRQSGTIARAHISSSTLFGLLRVVCACSRAPIMWVHESISCVGGAAPPSQPTGCGGDYFLGGSGGAQQPRQLELGAQMALSRRRRRSLAAPSARRRCRCAPPDGRRRHGLDGLPPRPRRRRHSHRRRSLRRPPKHLPRGARAAAACARARMFAAAAVYAWSIS